MPAELVKPVRKKRNKLNNIPRGFVKKKNRAFFPRVRGKRGRPKLPNIKNIYEVRYFHINTVSFDRSSQLQINLKY